MSEVKVEVTLIFVKKQLVSVSVNKPGDFENSVNVVGGFLYFLIQQG